MINFNNVIENFNTVYENRNSPQKSYFLSASLELVKDKSQKASFFDIVEALQFRRWEIEGTPSETSKAIKKLWLQAKFIYDNEPFSIRAKSKLISLLDQSITEGTFLDKRKLETYSKQVQIYCELLYLCKLITHSEENLATLSEKVGMPSNLKSYAESLEEKYTKVVAFQKTSAFQFLQNLKYTDPLSYLGVFIEEENGQIINTYPELLQLFELAEYAPLSSKPRGKKDKSTKQKYSSQQLRVQMLAILKKTQNEELTFNQKEILAFTYGFFKESKMKIEEFQDFIKSEVKFHKDTVLPVEQDISRTEKCIEYHWEADSLLLDYIRALRSLCDVISEGILKKRNPLPVCTLDPIAKVHNAYIKTLKKFIGNFKRNFTPLPDRDPMAKTSITAIKEGLFLEGTKGIFLENRKKRFGADFVTFLQMEQDIVSEHFPTLNDPRNYLSTVKTRSQVKKEVESIDLVYSSLVKELSKIALSRLSSQKKIPALPAEYQSFFTVLGCDSTSLPSPEKLISLNLKHPTKDFFSEEDVQALDKLIINFEDLHRKIFEQKIQTYCKEYIILKTRSLKKPEVVEEESFVSSIVLPESASIPSAEERPPVIKEEKIVPIHTLPSTTGAIPKNTGAKELHSSSKSKTAVYKKSRKPAKELFSFTHLPSIYRDKNLARFYYHDRVSRWSSDPTAALQDPAYKNLTKTLDNQQETLAFHAFPKIIDSLIGTNYCEEGEYTNKCGNLIKTYDIPGTILIQDIKHIGYFRYVVNTTAGVCFHRCFEPDRKSIAKNRAFTDSQHFSHEELDIQFHPKEQTIQIHDPNHDMEIYIYPPSLANQ